MKDNRTKKGIFPKRWMEDVHKIVGCGVVERKYEPPFVTVIYRKILRERNGEGGSPIDGAGGRNGMGMCKITWSEIILKY